MYTIKHGFIIKEVANFRIDFTYYLRGTELNVNVGNTENINRHTSGHNELTESVLWYNRFFLICETKWIKYTVLTSKVLAIGKSPLT